MADDATPAVEEPTADAPSTEAEQESTEQGATEQPGYFDEKFDPDKLAPELRAQYDSMRADYTRKTQQLSEQRQEIEPLRSWFDALQDEDTRDDAIQQLISQFGYTLEEAEQAADEIEEQFEEEDQPPADPRLDEVYEFVQEQRSTQEQQAVATLEKTINDGITDAAKKAGLADLDEDDQEEIFNEVIKLGPDENDAPRVAEAVTAFKARLDKRFERYVKSKTDVPAPPAKPGSSPTPTVKLGDSKARNAHALDVVNRVFDSQ